METAPTLILASRGDDPLMRSVTKIIEGAGVRTVSVPLVPSPLEAARADELHEAAFRAALDQVQGPQIIGGFSLGARIAARLCESTAPLGLLGFGYPFHAVGDASERHGLEALSRVRVPTRIVQGTRDSHGSEADVRGYRLPDSVEVVWLADGNHRFVPRARSGLTEAEHVEAAGAAALSFVRRCRR